SPRPPPRGSRPAAAAREFPTEGRPGLPALARGRCLRLPRDTLSGRPDPGRRGPGWASPRGGQSSGPTACFPPPPPIRPGFLPSFLPVRGIVKPPSPLATAEPGAAALETSVAGRGVPGAGAGVGAALLRPGPPRAAGGRRPEAGEVLVGGGRGVRGGG
uniref:Uncharacterized protein n=1 Tax=Oryctolagus cuniculus TaxID=9986 RepID=A0A5F9DBI7_RABIT